MGKYKAKARGEYLQSDVAEQEVETTKKGGNDMDVMEIKQEQLDVGRTMELSQQQQKR